MKHINPYDHIVGFRDLIERLGRHIAGGIKWWAEHQAWPATDVIRIDRHDSSRG